MVQNEKGYWKSLYNYFVLFQYMGTIWVICYRFMEMRITQTWSIRTLSALMILAQGIQGIIDWHGLFD